MKARETGFAAGAAKQAIAYLTELLENTEAKEETRLKAAGMILDRTVPKQTVRPEPEEKAEPESTTVRFEGELEKWSR